MVAIASSSHQIMEKKKKTTTTIRQYMTFSPCWAPLMDHEEMREGVSLIDDLTFYVKTMREI